jgi:L,D-transpeptidase catalytic domain
MKQTLKMTKHHICRRLTAYILIGVLVGIFLSACGTNANVSTKQSNTPTPVPTPAINTTMINQGNMQLQTFQQWIALLQQYNGDVTTYQKQYNDDQQALHDAHTDKAYNAILTTLSNHINTIKLPALQAEANTLHQTLEDKVTTWGSLHTYHDDYDGLNYPYGYEYTNKGSVGDDVYAMNNTAQTPKDYQQIIEDFNTYLTNFQAMTEEATDSTPYNQLHKADIQLLQKYGNMQGRVVVISLYGQAMRVYNNGQLVNAFLITTGTPAHPSLPGTWWVEQKQSPTVFKSVVPKGDPDYYDDTPVNFAMQYHTGGYNMHDSWWRADYGPGTEFPHIDSTGNRSATQGSHGCINMQENSAGWLYGYVDIGTPVIVY